MGIFGRRKVNNVAALPRFPAPGPTTIHHHGTNWPGIIFVGALCALASLPILWWFLVSLFSYLGSPRPEREVAFWLISIPIALVIGWFIKWLLISVLDTVLDYKLEVHKELTRREEVRLLAAQTTIDPGRMNEADYEFARLIVAVMEQAYSYLKANGPFVGMSRPWSRRSAKRLADSLGIKVSEDKANEVGGWLRDRDIISGPLGGQINAGRYKSLSEVREVIDKEFGKPITINLSPPLRDNRGWQFTE